MYLYCLAKCLPIVHYLVNHMYNEVFFLYMLPQFNGRQYYCTCCHFHIILKPVSIKTSIGNLNSLEVVGRISETQLQVGEILNNLIWRFTG